MKSLTEFLETNCELQEEEMQNVSGGSDLASAASNLAAGAVNGVVDGFGATLDVDDFVWGYPIPFS